MPKNFFNSKIDKKKLFTTDKLVALKHNNKLYNTRNK